MDLLSEADLILDGLLDLDLLDNLPGCETPPDDLLPEEGPPIASDPLEIIGVPERLLSLDDSLLGEDLLDDTLLGEDLLDDSLEVLGVLERLLDDLLPGVALLDEPLEARSLEAEPLTDGTEVLLVADLLSRGDLDLTLLLDREAVLLESPTRPDILSLKKNRQIISPKFQQN